MTARAIMGLVRPPRGQIYAAPRHPYTKALLGAIPRPHLRGRQLPVIPGAPPDLSVPDPGCRFRPRCRYGADACEQAPPEHDLGDGRRTACHEWERVGSA